MDAVKVYKGSNSPFLFEVNNLLGEKYSSTEMAAITRMWLKYTPTVNGVEGTPQYIDSALPAHASVFDKETYAADALLAIDIGLIDLTIGRSKLSPIMIYDPNYTSGRVFGVVDIEVVADVEGSVEGAGALSMISGVAGLPSLILDDDYTVQLEDFSRKSLRLDSLTTKTFTLPEMTEDEDDFELNLLILNVGDLILQCSGSDTISNQTATTFTGEQKNSSCTLEYVWSTKTFIVRRAVGKWEAV